MSAERTISSLRRRGRAAPGGGRLTTSAATLSVLAVLIGTSVSATVPAAAGVAPAAAAPGTLFVANSGGSGSTGLAATGSVTSYSLGARGNARPKSVLSEQVNGPDGVAFDSSGDLWVASSNGNKLLEFKRAGLAARSPVPAVIISSDAAGDLNGPSGMAFTSSGKLWVANSSTATVVEYTKAQLAKSGSPAPAVIISSTNFQYPYGLAFGPSGDLWVADGGQDLAFEFTPAQLARSGAPAPVRLIVDPAPTAEFQGDGVAFDAAGNMWVTIGGNNTLVEYTKAGLARSSPVPAVTISAGASGSLNAPNDLVFDPSGDLWVANEGNGTVIELTRPELAKSGAPVPARVLAGAATGLNSPRYLAIQPGGSAR